MDMREPFDCESTATPPPAEHRPLGVRSNAAARYSHHENPTQDELADLLRALAHKAPFTELKHQLERLSYRLEIPVADVLLRSEFVWHQRSKVNSDDMNQVTTSRAQWTSYGTLLHEAVRENELDLVKYLISPYISDGPDQRHEFLERHQGADTHAVDIHGWTAMHHAMEKGRIEIARLLYAEDATVMNKPAFRTGDTPLHVLIRKADVRIVGIVTREMKNLDWFKPNNLGLGAFDLAQMVIGDADFLRYLKARVLVDGWQSRRKQARDAFERAQKKYGQYRDLPTGKGFRGVDDEVMDGSWEDFTKVTVTGVETW
ncbi:hypothetical protein QBC36DRAFT_295073 [Triangularia setosa]|uniref:Ankyrin n=1 Tax=Triangularia setosa TaxID=2587417 RepID=A0AAN7A379_9PEZI|nr:hypothetical protein QBC36DRAFT_295073 [Podospora setosa]